MKQHSYAFYNGHLSEVHRRSAIIQKALSELQIARDDGILVASHGKLEHHHHIQTQGKTGECPDVTTVNDLAIDTELCGLLVQDGHELTADQIEQLRSVLEKELEGCEVELGGKKNVKYPQNLTWKNYLEYLFFPT